MSALDNVKHWMKTNYPAACAGFSIPCEQSSKEHECPLCGKRKFRVRTTGATAGTYICTCGVKGAGFGILDLIARIELGASTDTRVDGSTLRKAAKLVDERLSLGLFATEPGYKPPTAQEREAAERERKEAFEQRQREATEQEELLIASAAPRVRDILTKAVEGESAYLKAKGFDKCVLPVTARGDGVLRLTDIDILTDLLTIPFRRSADKDRREISDSLCLIADFIEKYRYRGTDERYREYAQTIITGIDTERLPPMIAGLIVQEVTTLVDTACATNVMTFANAGITHEEYWRFTDPDEYADSYHDGEIPEDASPLKALDVYPQHEGIAQQSLWYGLDNYTDDFIVSLAGGLLYAKQPVNRIN